MSKRDDLLKKYAKDEITAEEVSSWLKQGAKTATDYKRKDSSKYTTDYDSETSSTVKPLLKKADAVWKYLRNHKNEFKNYDELNKQFGAIRNSLTGINAEIDGVNEYYSQWETEEDYNKAVKAQEDYDFLVSYNFESGQKGIDYLTNELNAINATERAISKLESEKQTYELAASKGSKDASNKLEEINKQIDTYNDALKKAWGKYGSKNQLEAEISKRTSQYNRAKVIQDGIKLTNDAVAADNFEEKSQYVSTKDGNGWWDKLWSKDGLGYNDPTYEYINNIDDYRDEYEFHYVATAANPNSAGESDLKKQGLAFMTDEEIAIYNYYYATEGKEKAESYLKTIQESLNARKANKDFEKYEGNTFAETLFGVEAGIDQFKSGIANLFNTEDDYIPPSSTQMLSSKIREDLADASIPMWYNFKEGEWEDKILGNSLGQGAYDLTTTTSNMLPSIITSYAVGVINPVAGQAVGAGLMGGSAAGNAYAEMLNLGYDKGQARLYSSMVGASEATLQYLLGGVGKLGGKLTNKAVIGIANNMDNAFARVAIKLGGNMAGEFSEEYLQEVLNPFFKNLTLGTNEDVTLFSSEALYNGILGALSAGILEGGSTIASDVRTTNLGKNVQKIDGGVARLKKLGTTFSADSVAYQIADKVTEETGAYKIGLLLQEVGGTLSEQNVSDIVIELTKKGMDESSAKKIAKLYQEFLNGEMSLTDEQVETLENLEPLANVLRKSIIGRNSAVYQRTREYNDLVQLATEMESESKESSAPQTDTEVTRPTNVPYSTEYIESVAKEYEAAGMSPEQAKIMAMAQLSASAEGKSLPTEENTVESKYEVSVDGKTINTKNDEIVTIKNIESISGDGEANLTLDDGMVVKASDLSFGSDAEAIFVENIGAIKVGKNPISTTSANALYHTAMKALKDNPNMTASEADSLIRGLIESYVYGTYNLGRSKLTARNKDGSARLFAGELSQEHRQFAYELGTQDSVSKAEADQKVIDELVEKAKANKDVSSQSTAKKGRVRFEDGVVAKGKLQKRTVSLAKHLAKALGIDIVFYDARTTTNPNGKDANGYFDEDTDTIYLDLQNSHDDAKTIAFTLSHELVHFIKKWSPAKFDIFAKFIMKQYTAHGVDSSQLLANKMSELGTDDVDYAYEEMICDACETMLLDSNAVFKLMELRKTDLELFDKIKLHIHNLLNKIRGMYKSLGLKPTSDEAKALLEIKDVLEQIYSLFEDAAVDAARSYQAVSTLETESVSVSKDGTVMMQMKQYQQTGRATLLKYLKEQYGDADANNLIATIDNIYNTMKDIKKDETLSVFSNWQDSEVELDENGHPIFTTSINNGDYELNQDFSRVCKKRRQLDFVLNMLAEDPAFEASNLTKQDFVKINKAIKEHGFEIACALCFVDSKRFRQAEWADSFANTWNDILYSIVDDTSKLTPFNFATKNPNLADDGIEIDTSKPVMYRKWSEGKEDVKNRKNYDSFDTMLSKDGKKWIEGNANVRTIATLIRDNPNLRHTFRGADIIASQGFDTIQRLAPGIRGILDGWGGSSVPKPSSSDASYDSSIINLSGYNKETAYAMGGARMNSFSDFMAHMFFDYCQAFADLAAKELPSQAYTKELIYVRLFGRSGQKINMSGIAAVRDDALPTTAQKGVSKAEAEANEKIEKMVAGLDVSRLLEHLNKDIHQLTEADVEQFLDMCDYVWADESINMKHATLLQTGILYDKLSDSKVEECYELLKAGEVEQALKVAGKQNVDTEYAKHCGTIVVGVSDAHIRKLLRDTTVRMVIPYHKSGLNPVIARELRISAYNDYTLTQTTGVRRKGSKATAKIGSDEIKTAYGLKDFAFYDWFGKTINGKVYDGKATADKYLEWCEKGYYDKKVGDYVYYTTKGDGYILAKEFHKKATIVPKFEAFIGEENYYKVLEDFDCYNTISGEHSAQGAVDFLRNGLPSDYKSVLMDALKAEQKVHDDFKDHLDNKGLKDEIMDIVKANGYKPSVKKQAKRNMTIEERKSGSQIADFIDAVSHMLDQSKISKRKLKIGTISDVHRKTVESLMKTIYPNFSAEGYELWIDGTGAEHINIRHGENGEADKTMALREDRELIPWVANSPDGGEFVRGESGGLKLSNRFFNADGSKAPQIRLHKIVDGDTVYVSECVPDSKNKRIYITSAYKKSSTNQLLNIDSNESPQPTSETSFDSGATKHIIKRDVPKVKKQLKKDSLGNELSKEQIEFFKDSKVRDENGNLKVMYHGTPNGDFNTFKISDGAHSSLMAQYGAGYYFDSNKDSAKRYTQDVNKTVAKRNPKVFEAYLNIKNPLVIHDEYLNGKEPVITKQQFIGVVSKGNYEWMFTNGMPFELTKYLEKTKSEIQQLPREEIIKHWVDMVYDRSYFDSEILSAMVKVYKGDSILGVMKDVFGNDGVKVIDKYGEMWVAWDNSQIKETSNTNPTTNPDIRYQKKTGTSNRSLLANALESAAQNDIERNKLAQYKEKISLIESEERKLSTIQKQLFSKDGVEPSQRKALQTEARQIANRINTYDRQLLNLEATTALKNVLNREKALAMKKQKQMDAEYLKQYKEKVQNDKKALVSKYQESRKKAVESRTKTAMRHKIKNVVSELNRMLLKGSKERNVKLDLQNAVASALEAINMDTIGAEERIAKLEQELLKAKTPEKIQEISRKIDNIRGQGDRMSSKLNALKRAYEKIKANDDNLPNYFTEEASLIIGQIEATAEKVGDTPLRYMSLAQLEAVHDLYNLVLTTVRNANKVFVQGKLEDLQHNASATMEELSSIRTLPEERADFGWLRSFSWNEMIPVYAFRRIGSKTFEKFFWEAIRGQNVVAQDLSEANDFAKDTREKYGYKKWDLDKVHEFKLADGRTFRVTLRHMMSIYAYSKRNQALDHMTKGGFFFNDKSTFRKKGGIIKLIKSNEVGYSIDLNTLEAIVNEMTPEQRKYVDDMQTYLTKMGDKGNEVSRVLWGIDIFKEKVYFPLKSVKDFIYQTNQTAQESSLKNDGMTKETKPGASNPIVLEAFDDVWASHVNRMSQYHGLVIPIENLNKIHNYGTWANTESMSVSTMLRARFGEAVNDYLNNFIKDLNGATSVSGASNPFFSFVGKFKKTAVAASASVVVQQPTAIARAAAVMDMKYFIGLPKAKSLSAQWSELQKYAPIAIIKEIGGFDAGAGRQATEWLNSDTRRGIDKIEGKIDDITMKGAAIGDQLGWCTIWEAVKREIKSTTDLKVGSEEFLKKAGERFTEVIVLTQVYDSTLSRSGFMRSKHDSVKMLTAFMGEPTVSINMMADATIQAKRGTITKRKAGRIIGAVYTSIILASIASSLIYGLRDDDEDESYLEKFAEALGGKLLDEINPFNMLPGIRDIISIFDGWDIERTDMAIFKDIKDAFDGLSSDNKSAWRKVEDFTGAIASIFGVPLKNVLRSARETYNAISNIFDDVTPSNVDDAFVRGVTGEKKDKSKSLYDAIINGDDARLEIYRKEYTDDNAYEQAVRKALRENDPRIREAAEALYNGDVSEYDSITNEIINEGHFDIDDIKAVIKSEYNDLKPDEEQEEDDNETSIYFTYQYYDALIEGDLAMANKVKEDIIRTEIANGKSESDAMDSFYDSFRNDIRDGYADETLSHEKAMDMLVKYGGMDNNEAYWQMEKYDYYVANGTTDGYSKYSDFYEAVKTGKNLKSVIKKYTDHGVKDSTLASQITSYYKPLYIQMTNKERANIKGYLLNAYSLLGKNRAKKSRDIDNWLKDKY